MCPSSAAKATTSSSQGHPLDRHHLSTWETQRSGDNTIAANGVGAAAETAMGRLLVYPCTCVSKSSASVGSKSGNKQNPEAHTRGNNRHSHGTNHAFTHAMPGRFPIPTPHQLDSLPNRAATTAASCCLPLGALPPPPARWCTRSTGSAGPSSTPPRPGDRRLPPTRSLLRRRTRTRSPSPTSGSGEARRGGGRGVDIF